MVFALLNLAAGFLYAEEIVYDAEGKRDPFVPLTGEAGHGEAGSSSGFKLEGIIYDPGAGSMAILNGKSYLTGDDAEGATVVRIEKDHVVISVGGEEKTLRMRPELVSASQEAGL